MGLFLRLFLVFLLANWFSVGNWWLCFIVFFCISCMMVYFLIFRRWGSVSKYGLLGCYRSVSQSVVYEVSLVIFALSILYLFGLFDFMTFWFFQEGYVFCFFRIHLFVMWFLVCLVEAGRTPFDFLEGESELVSGFNVEYGGGVFSLIFICEYSRLILFGILSAVIFLGIGFFVVKIFLFVLLYVWLRGVLPRFRYDFLMSVGWQSFLPLSVGLVFLCFLLNFLEKILFLTFKVKMEENIWKRLRLLWSILNFGFFQCFRTVALLG